MKRRLGFVTTALLLVAVGLTLAVAACRAPAPAPTPTPGPTATPRVIIVTPTPLPTPTPTATPVKEKIPPTMVIFASVEPEGAIYQQIMGVGNAIKEQYGTATRILPTGDDAAKFIAARSGKAQFVATGNGPYFTFEGLEDFADIRWGPQPISLVWQSPGKVGIAPLTTKASGIKTPANMKGKRVGFIVGSPALNVNVEAWLAFANLTWNDVKVTKFSGYQASIQGLIKGEVDVIMGYGLTPNLIEIQAVGGGMQWIEFPTEDKEGWARLQRVAPYMLPEKATAKEAIGAPEDKALQLTGYPTPNVVAYTDQVSEELVYFWVKGAHTLYPKYKDVYRELPKWEIKQSLIPAGLAPYHPGVVKYLKEIGMWNDEYQKFQDKMLKKQKTLLETWDKTIEEATTKGLPSKEIPGLWLKNREQALKALGS